MADTSVVERYYGEDVSTASDTDDSTGSYQLNLSSRTVQVTWEVEGLARHIPSLKADLHVDTEQGTALITLRGQCILKAGPSSGVALYLFIYPENIRSVEFAYTPSPTAPTITMSLKQGGGAQQAPMAGPPNRFIRLRFILIQPPTFVAPKNQPLEPKGASTALVDALQSLATVKELSIYLDLLSLVAEAREQLALLPLVFSRCRLATNEKRASIARLYRGVGGEVVNSRTTALVQEAEQGSPTHAISAASKLQDAAQISTPTQTRTRKRAASASPSPSEFLPPYPAGKDEGVLPGSGNDLDQTEKKNVPQSQQSTQLYTPSDRDSKRPRLEATTPSDRASPPTLLPPLRDTLEVEVGVDASTVDVDPQKLSFLIHQLLSRNAALEKRVQHLEVSSTSRSRLQGYPHSHTQSHSSPSHHSHHSPFHPHSTPSHHPQSQTSQTSHSHQPSQNIQTCPHEYCRYNTSEASSIRSSIRHRIDDALETGLDTACSKLEDWAHLEFQEQVRAEITGQLEDLGRELGREWRDDLREDVKYELKDEIREEIAGEVLKRAAKGVVDVVRRSGWLGPLSPLGPSNSGRGHGHGLGAGAGSGAGPHGLGSGGAYPGAGGNAISGFNPLLPPNEQSLFAAVADIQKTFTTYLSDEEMARVMDHLEENPLSAVKYNACGEGMRRFFVGRWKDDDVRGRTGGGWRGGAGLG
ncbi:hypothetical protein B0T09DRAFT_155035 [Sordaria sp. MPI-SDFR-AT-0083]|nr:hypothetical protein B0T09DRAFT_155035 [Sordaria sp. MPI-SDFR-AT-0083]